MCSCFQLNIVGTHFLVKRALPLLFKSPAGFERTVVFTSSNESYLTDPTEGNGLLAYRASKAAINGIMVGLHQLFVAKGSAMAGFIRESPDPVLHRVVSVHPGYTQVSVSHSAVLLVLQAEQLRRG